MPLHLLKLAVGCESIDDLETGIATRLATCRAAKQPAEHIHQTRMMPRRVTELLDGGSLFWVIRGKLAARQRLLEIRPFIDHDGTGRCMLVLEPEVHAVSPRPCRPFQGWRYLTEDKRPADLGGAGPLGLPRHLACELRELCLI